jgi:hypothetical protein
MYSKGKKQPKKQSTEVFRDEYSKDKLQTFQTRRAPPTHMKTQKYTPKAELRLSLEVVDDDGVSNGLMTDSSFKTKKGTDEKSREVGEQQANEIQNHVNLT